MNPKPYDEYKDSGVDWIGSVPAHWPLSPLRSVVEERRIKNPDGNEAFYLSLVSGRGVIPYSQKGDIGNKMPEDLSRCKVVEEGDLVINSMNYGIGSYGVSSYQGICSPVYIVLRPKPSVDVSFIKRIFEVRGFQKLAQSFGSGILEHRSAISWQTLKTLRVPVPTLTEQRVIAEFLDRETAEIDAFIADQERLIELLQERRAATITHAVTKGLDPNAPMKDSGIQWIRETPTHWTVVPLRRMASVVNGGTPTQNETNWGGSIPWATPVDLNHFDGTTISSTGRTLTKQGLLTGSTTVPAGSVLLSTRAPVGYVSRTTSSIAFNQGCKGVVPRREYLNTIFLMYALIAAKAELTVRSQGTTFLELSTNALLGIPFPIPMVEEQHDIVDFLDREISDIDAAISDAQEAIALSKERRAALVSAAVTGQIDVTKKPSRESTGEVLDEEVPV